MNHNARIGSEDVQPQFIFGPIGNGYRLTGRQRRIVEGIGAVLLIPGVILLVLAKLGVVSFVYGSAGFGAALVIAFAATKIYVSSANIPYVTRPLSQKLLANSGHLPLFFIYFIPIVLGLLIALVGYEAVSHAAAGDCVVGEWLLTASLIAALLASLALGLWVKRKRNERRYDGLE